MSEYTEQKDNFKTLPYFGLIAAALYKAPQHRNDSYGGICGGGDST